MDETLLSRIEDAGINASAPPQQRWMDGWLVRTSPGKAKRARCINAVAVGLLPVEQKLAMASAMYAAAALPMFVRITPFSQPGDLDRQLERLGYPVLDDTRVMVRTNTAVDSAAAAAASATALPEGTRWQPLAHDAFADAVGDLRGSPKAQRLAQAARLAQSPVPYRGFAIVQIDDGTVLACGQVAQENELVGLYDVFTRASARNRGLAAALCRHLLRVAADSGATTAYLQVEGDNHAARRIYQRLGFAEAYRYHYRVAS